mgnify:CR=1 FL=1
MQAFLKQICAAYESCMAVQSYITGIFPLKAYVLTAIVRIFYWCVEGYQTNHRFKNSEDGIVMWFLCFSKNHFWHQTVGKLVIWVHTMIELIVNITTSK